MHLSYDIVFALATVVSVAPHASAWWILGCGQPVVVERVDPIVSPGGLGGHVHAILGGNAFTKSMTYDTTQESQ